MKKGSFFKSLPFKLLVAVILGILSGLVLNRYSTNGISMAVLNIVVTVKYILGQIITFCVPLIVLGFIAPSITKLGKNASVMLGVAVVLAYGSSIGAALFSTAFAGVKSVFQAIAAHQAISWNSFLDVTAVLLVVTCLFGRHFCGYACAFGSLGDALYELTVFIRQKVFHKKGRHGYSEKAIRILQKVKYIWLLVLLVSILTGWYSKLQGMSPWDVFSMLTAGRLPGAAYKVGIVLLLLIMIGMCTQERFFCQFLCPMGAIFAIMPIAPSALFNRDRSTCPAKCGACKKRCPAHLDIDGDTLLSGECICCHACQGICPKKNIRIGIPKMKDESSF